MRSLKVVWSEAPDVLYFTATERVQMIPFPWQLLVLLLLDILLLVIISRLSKLISSEELRLLE